jgi:hypothetical protein
MAFRDSASRADHHAGVRQQKAGGAGPYASGDRLRLLAERIGREQAESERRPTS